MLRRLRYAPLVLALAVAGFLPTLAFSRTAVLRATGTTIMLVSQGVTTTLSSAGLEHKVTAMSNTAAQQATIIVVVHGRVIVNSPASSYRSFAINAAWNAAAANVRTAIASVEMYRSDNHPGSHYDPDSSRTDSGYMGMTIKRLAHAYDLNLPKDHVVIIRATRTSYCMESTVDGVTVFKNGPKALMKIGHC
jgi:hypothetical protein